MAHDEGHRLTDRELAALERKIRAVYREVRESLDETIREYFAKLEGRDKHQQELLKAGEITEEQYKQWRLNQIGRGKRYEALRDEIARRYTDANEVVAAYINDTTPRIYSLNRNYAAYTIEQAAGNADFTLWDEQTVRRLLVEDPDLMPYYPPDRALKRGIDLAWGRRQISASVTSNILLGKSIGKIATDLQDRIEDMNRTSALRVARTAMTGAQNAGRQDSYIAAEKMGIKLKREWLAALDNRTRHAHAMLDGQQVAVDEPFKVDGYEIMFPGDPTAKAYLVYNCRCTMVALVDGVDTSDTKRRAINPVTGESVVIEDMTYREWEAWKKSENQTAWEAYQKKGKNASADKKQHEEYRSVLGNKVPAGFADFQKMKYNDPEKWDAIKTLKRQTGFVNTAECETTARKFTGYLLKPGAKHSQDFFDVGYSKDNPTQLRYDIAKAFDMSKAVNRAVDKNGVETFNIYMHLGVDEKKQFLTGWQIDAPGQKPRIITAFRKDKGND